MEFSNLIIASLTGRNEFPSFTFTFGENDTLAEVCPVFCLFTHRGEICTLTLSYSETIMYFVLFKMRTYTLYFVLSNTGEKYVL